jgi:hypothetical protein
VFEQVRKPATTLRYFGRLRYIWELYPICFQKRGVFSLICKIFRYEKRFYSGFSIGHVALAKKIVKRVGGLMAEFENNLCRFFC